MTMSMCVCVCYLCVCLNMSVRLCMSISIYVSITLCVSVSIMCACICLYLCACIQAYLCVCDTNKDHLYAYNTCGLCLLCVYMIWCLCVSVLSVSIYLSVLHSLASPPYCLLCSLFIHSHSHTDPYFHIFILFSVPS